MVSSHPFFKLGRSCRQGDPLSPYLFILAVEPLASAIRFSDIINGLSFGKSERSITESLYVLDLFYKCSGLRMNMQKTQAVWIGDMKGIMDLQKKVIVSPDESRGYLALSTVTPPQRFPFGRDNLKNILVRTFKFGMWVYMGNATNAIVL